MVPAAVGGRKLWRGICRRENLIALVMAAAVTATEATVAILALVMAEGLAMVSLQL